MKYIMIETSEGARMPFLFPESCTHSVMAELMRTMLDWFHNMKATIVVSAGFVNMGTDLTVHGESESLGGLKSVKADAARIILGHAIQFMPDPMVTMLLGQLEGNVRSGVDSDLAIAIAEHAFNAGFDWMFIEDYFQRFLGRNPFGHSALDMKAYYMGKAGTSWAQTSMRFLSPRYLGGQPLSHNALGDARAQAELFRAIVAEIP